jgi:hypothetical protein
MLSDVSVIPVQLEYRAASIAHQYSALAYGLAEVLPGEAAILEVDGGICFRQDTTDALHGG